MSDSGGLLNYVIMQIVINNERSILLSNQGTRTWSGQVIQGFNANAVLWGALGKEMYGPSGPYFIVPLGIVMGLALPVIPVSSYCRGGARIALTVARYSGCYTAASAGRGSSKSTPPCSRTAWAVLPTARAGTSTHSWSSA
jgi:hypothetical protein